MPALELLAAIADEQLARTRVSIGRELIRNATVQHVPALEARCIQRHSGLFAACAPSSIRQAGLRRSQTADDTHGAVFAALNDRARHARAVLIGVRHASVDAAGQLFTLTLAPAGKLRRALAYL